MVLPQKAEDGSRYLAFNNEEKQCVYLHEGKCLVHKDKPETCRAFDCRKLTLVLSKKQALDLGKNGSIDIEVWERGKELLLGGLG